MKKKSLTMLLTGLLAMSLTGVGFASWIIVQGDEKYQDATVNVEKIEKKDVTLSLSWAESDNKFSFGPSSLSGTGWLRNPNGEVQDLDLTLNIEVTENVDLLKDISVSVEAIEANDEHKTGYADAIDAKYITAITASKTTISKSDLDDNKCSVNISVGWGDFWDGNPYDYYKDLEATTENITHAETHIGNLYKYLTGVSFRVTVTSNV